MRRTGQAIWTMVAGLMAGLMAGPAMAHPHIFIDTGIEVIFDDQGRAAALRVAWSYDEFYSLVALEDRGLDPDYDGVLTAEETAALSGFDMQWDAGFAGDTYALLGTAPLALGPPQDWTAELAGERIVSTHLRAILSPVRPVDAPLVVQAYDPGYYTSYAIAGTPLLTGAAPGCTVQVLAPDLSAADQRLKDALAEYSGTEDVEADFPAIGAVYAEEAQVRCSDGS